MPPMTNDALERSVHDEFATFHYPEESWTRPRMVDGRLQYDAVVIGAGQAGIAIALRLVREGVGSLLVIDRAPQGKEGPWVTWARMRTLRTAKTLFGTEAGIHTASFRNWYEQTRSVEAYDELNLIPRETWMEYLTWLRETFALPVQSETEVTKATPDGAHWRLEIASPAGAEVIHARKLIVCTGLDGLGGPIVPPFLAPETAGLWRHSSEDIDYDAYAGKTVVVLGIGASAFDNAATALEHGAAKVVQIGRRPTLPRVNSLRFLEKKGLFRHFGSMTDVDRLGFVRREFAIPVPPPSWSVERCTIHENYELVLGTSIESAHDQDGRLVLRAGDTEFTADLVVAATGFAIDVTAAPWLAEAGSDIALWRDKVELEETPLDARIGGYPYLGDGMATMPKPGVDAPALANLHLFNITAHASFGIACIGNNGMHYGADTVANEVTKGLLREDAAALLAEFEHYDDIAADS